MHERYRKQWRQTCCDIGYAMPAALLSLLRLWKNVVELALRMSFVSHVLATFLFSTDNWTLNLCYILRCWCGKIRKHVATVKSMRTGCLLFVLAKMHEPYRNQWMQTCCEFGYAMPAALLSLLILWTSSDSIAFLLSFDSCVSVHFVW